MNTIINSFLQTHIAEYKLENLEQNIAFEHFINRCIINKYVFDRFDPNDVMTDEGERGLDGVAIIFNGRLITSEDDLQDEFDKKQLSLNFVFIQSKTSDSFSGADIGSFIRGVKAFFAPHDQRPKTNEKMEQLIKIKDILYSKILNIKNPPTLEMYYACCGGWRENNGLRADINLDIQSFKDSNEFSKVDFFPYDSEKIITSYKELKKKISRSILMEKRISFAPIEGVSQAFLGIVKCKDFISLLRDSEGNILANIFEDNVRDFQGYNTVNKEIKETILNIKDQERFAVLNNGITIVAKDITTTGDTIELFDYQIVNGCQTSYVLYDNATFVQGNSYVVLKVIEVANEEISDRVIFTTNRQTEVKSEAFTSTKLFHKRLQDYYNSIDPRYRLYYERRSKQYDLYDDIDKNHIVTLANQVLAYIAMFLNEPHSTHRYYGELLNAYSNKLFLDDDIHDLYYIAAYCNFILDQQFKMKKIDWDLKKFKYHIMLAFRSYFVGSQVVFGQKRIQKSISEKLFKIIMDNSTLQSGLKSAIMCVENAIAASTKIPSFDLHRNREVTNEIIRQVELMKKAENCNCYLKKEDIVHCCVIGVDRSYINVRLKTDDSRNNGFIHISQVSKEKICNLRALVKLEEVFQAKIISDSYYDSKWGWELTKIL